MGHVMSRTKEEYLVHAKTGDIKGAGTDADVWLILHDDCGLKTQPVKLNAFFKNDHERQRISVFRISCPVGFHNAERIEIWRGNDIVADSWYLEYLMAEKREDESKFWFPINRWILPDRRYRFRINDCVLPQNDTSLTQRNSELLYKRKLYEYTHHLEGGPAQVMSLPQAEDFRYLYKWDFSAKVSEMFGYRTLLGLIDGKWESIGELLSLYRKEFPQPPVIDRWKDDGWFAAQRLQGVNPTSITLCTELPEGFVINANEIQKLLDNMTFEEALNGNRIFFVDHWILKNLPCKDDRMICAPIALFYLNMHQELVPIAIQLFQDLEADNPVFYPSDPPNNWLLAKMYFNNADAAYHRACLSIGKTHFLMESIWVAVNRHLSPSHPLYKLMAPHFSYLLTVNQLILEKLLPLGGWLDRVTTLGVRGICHLIVRWFSGLKFDRDLNIKKQIQARGVLDSEILPYYPYRDDAITVFDVLYQYVTKIVEHYYDDPEKVIEDVELQNWRKELVKGKKLGGCAIDGIPGDADSFTKTEQIVETITAIISTCTVFHSAVNLPQYEESAFVPNYPLSLKGPIPRDKHPLSQKEIADHLPTIHVTTEMVNGLKTLSSEIIQTLGHRHTICLTEENDAKSHKQFTEELRQASDAIRKRNNYRKYSYRWLDPEIIPDYIAS